MTWDGEEHRSQPPHTLAEAVERIERKVDERIMKHLSLHNEQEIKRTDAVAQEMREGIVRLEKLFKSAFPADDPHQHRAYHEEQAEFMRDVRGFFRYVAQTTTAGIVWAMIVGLGVAVWQYVKSKIHGQ